MNRTMSFLLLSGLLSAVSLRAQQPGWSVPYRLPMGVAGVLAGVDHGVVLIGGGCNFPDSMPWAGGKKRYYNELYVLDQHGVRLCGVKLFENTAYGASVSTPRGIVYIGGENEHGLSSKAFCLRWKAGKADVEMLPDLPLALTNASAAVIGDVVYVAGGETATGVSDGLFALDDGRWERVSTLPKPLSHAVFIAAGRKLYLVGGRRRNPGGVSDLSDGVFCYDPATRVWTVCHSLPYALSAGTGVLYDEDHLLLIGGDRGETFHKVEKLIADIGRTGDTALIQEKARVQSSHPGFSSRLLSYDISQDKWVDVGALPLPSPVTTTAAWWDGHIVIPGGEVRAGVRTSQILISR